MRRSSRALRTSGRSRVRRKTAPSCLTWSMAGSMAEHVECGGYDPALSGPGYDRPTSPMLSPPFGRGDDRAPRFSGTPYPARPLSEFLTEPGCTNITPAKVGRLRSRNTRLSKQGRVEGLGQRLLVDQTFLAHDLRDRLLLLQRRLHHIRRRLVADQRVEGGG